MHFYVKFVQNSHKFIKTNINLFKKSRNLIILIFSLLAPVWGCPIFLKEELSTLTLWYHTP